MKADRITIATTATASLQALVTTALLLMITLLIPQAHAQELANVTIAPGHETIPGYAASPPGSASPMTAVPIPAIIVHLSEPSHNFLEGSNRASVGVVARARGGLLPPDRAFSVSVSTRQLPEGATSGVDYEPLSALLRIRPADYRRRNGAWEARRFVRLTINDDTVPEPDEALDFLIERVPGLPPPLGPRIVLLQENGRGCPSSGCRVTAVIEDDDEVPSAPQQLSFEPRDRAVRLFWQASANGGANPTKRHQYRMSMDAGLNWNPDWTDIPDSAQDGGENAASYLVNGLINGTEYTFELRAVNDVGAGKPARGEAVPFRLPSSPRNLSFTPGNGDVTLFWDLSTDNGGRPVTAHQYRISDDDGGSWSPNWSDIPESAPDGGSNATSFLIPGLTNGTRYTFEVRAVNEFGPGEAVRGATMPSATPPGSIGGICDRTPAVREQLMVLLRKAVKPGYEGDCGGVTAAWLSRLQALQLHTPANQLSTLRRGDFAGLIHVTSLYIVGQSNLTTLPTGVFEGLTGLEEIWAFDNGIAALETGAFRGLPSLRHLRLQDNRIARVAPGAFAGLNSLEILVLRGNLIESFPFDEFESLPALRDLFITGNPGHVHAVEASATSLNVAPGGSASYRLRLTARPSIAGARVNATSDFDSVSVSPQQLDFADDDWFRAREVTVSAPLDAAPATGNVIHEVPTGNYAFRMANTPPQVRVTVAAAGQAQSPAALSVTDSRGREGEDVTMDFVVVLSRSDPGKVAVSYATADGTAIAGEDFVNASGILTFASDETEKTVSIEILDDAHDEGEEKFTLKLFDPSGAYLVDDQAVGMIVNSDPMPKAWLARFGRTASVHAVEAIEDRLGGRQQSTQVTLGGHRLDRPHSLRDTDRREASLSATGFPELTNGRGPAGDAGVPDWRDLLMGSSFLFQTTLENGSASANGLDRWAAWGRGARTRVSGTDDELALNGEIVTATLGADAARGSWMAGIALAHSLGEGTYAHETAPGGTVSSTLTSLHPYLGYRINSRSSLWGTAGYGVGTLKMTSESLGSGVETDSRTAMAAIGGRGVLRRRPDGFELAIVSDVLTTRTESEATAGLAGAGGTASRIRLMLAGSGSVRLPRGGELTPTLEAGLRYDGGDAETGAGVEIGGGIAYSRGRLSLQIDGRTLLAHEENEFRENGFSGSVSWQPGDDGRGLSIRLGSSWGATGSGVNSLWSEPNPAGLTRGAALDRAQRMQAELGYGFTGPGGRRLWTPFLHTESGIGDTAIRTGLRFSSNMNAGAGVELDRRKHAGGGIEHAIELHWNMRW